LKEIDQIVDRILRDKAKMALSSVKTALNGVKTSLNGVETALERRWNGVETAR